MTTDSHLRAGTRESRTVTVVRVVGDIDIAAAADFPELVAAAVASPVGVVVFDLSEVSFIDSGGLEALTEARAQLRGAGMEVVWRAPSPAMVQLLGWNWLITSPEEVSRSWR